MVIIIAILDIIDITVLIAKWNVSDTALGANKAK